MIASFFHLCVCVCVCVCVWSHCSHVWLFVTLWTVACQTPLPICILQARILKQIALLQEIFLTQDQTCISYVSCIGRRFFFFFFFLPLAPPKKHEMTWPLQKTQRRKTRLLKFNSSSIVPLLETDRLKIFIQVNWVKSDVLSALSRIEAYG